MRLSLVQGIGLLVLLLVGTGCSSPKPPPPPVPQPTAKPPPAPKCNTLKDACKAGADTRAPIPEGVDYTFQPPSGWLYAKLPDTTVAQIDDFGAVLAATSIPLPKKGRTAQRAKAVNGMAELIGVVPTKVEASLTLKKPSPDSYNGLPVSLWEVEVAKRGDNKGALVVLSADVGERELIMVGFAPADDQDGTMAIMDSLRTLAPKPADEGSAGGGDDAKPADEDGSEGAEK